MKKVIADQTGTAATVLTPDMHPSDFLAGEKGLIPSADAGCSQG